MSAKIFIALLLVGLKLCSGAVIPLSDPLNGGSISNINATTTTTKLPPTTKPTKITTLKTTTTKPTKTTTLKTTTTKPTKTTTLKTTATKPTKTTTLKTTTIKPTKTTTLKTTTTKPTKTTTLKTTTTKPTKTTTFKTTSTKPTATKKTTTAQLFTMTQSTTTSTSTTTTPPETTTEPTRTTETTTIIRTTEIPTTTDANFCTYNGKTYAINEEFRPEPCSVCWCQEGGQHLCAMMSCMACESGEPIYIPGQCCPGCNTTPFELQSTTPGYCEYDGKIYQAGEQFEPDPCTFCTCEEGGMTMCAKMSCPYCPSGTIYMPDQCCPICHPERVLCWFGGDFYNVGDSFNTDPCTFCTCGYDGQSMCSRYDCQPCEGEEVYVDGQCCPQCQPISTTTPTFCESNGQYYAVGETYMPDPCQHCACGDGGQPLCMQYRCEPCDGQPIYVPGQCCPECQKTTTREMTPPLPPSTSSIPCIHNDNIYSVGDSYWSDPCTLCYCKENGPRCVMRDCPQPECSNYYFVEGECCPKCQPETSTPPQGTTTPTSYCVEDGKYYQVGEYFNPNPCAYCYCAEGGQSQCAYASCRPCEGEMVHVDGQCCPECIPMTPMTPEMPTTTIIFCEHKGNKYAVGERFSDGQCGYCFCDEGGETRCAHVSCRPCEGDMVQVEGQCCPQCISMTPEMPSTTIMYCEHYGQTYAVGERFSDGPCGYCFCDEGGQSQCVYASCRPCEGEMIHVEGQCCPECIPMTPMTPSMPSYCKENGQIYQLGESFYPDPCTYCYCGDGGQVQCAYGECPTCYGYTVYEPGQCCPKCYPVPQIPTSTPPPSCQSNGITYEIGESYWSDPCTMCTCESQGPMCYKRDCARPECYDYYVVEGECCPQCRPDQEITTTPSSYETPCPTEELVEETTATAN